MMLVMFIAGLALLIIGAEFLVRGASRLAAGAGISPLVIGLTVVAWGTSAPELAVSVMAGAAGNADIALGNVVGSNIFNVLLILGISALIAPLTVSQQLVRLDVPLMIAASALLLVLGFDGRIGRIDGIVLIAGIVIYTFWLIHLSRKSNGLPPVRNKPAIGRPQKPIGWKWLMNAAMIAIGLVMLLLGSRWLVAGATNIAQHLGISSLVIGLTIVAAGTSLPEVATSIVASIRGERDIAVGNVVGSNIFNILAVLGAAALVSNNGVGISKAALHFDIPIMIAAAFACLPVFFTGYRISRWEGAFFLGCYAVYVIYLFLSAAQHRFVEPFNRAMLFFVLPMTLLTLILSVLPAIRVPKKRS